MIEPEGQGQIEEPIEEPTEEPTEEVVDEVSPKISSNTSREVPGALEVREEEENNAAWAQLLVLYSVLSGLCPLIPIPFVDDLIQGQIRQHFVRKQLRDANLDPSGEAQKILTRDNSGCALGCVISTVLYPIEKIFKKIFIFLSIKSCVDVASLVFHYGYLRRFALEKGLLDAALLQDPAQLLVFQSAIESTCKELDTRPINQILMRIFRGSRNVLRVAASHLMGEMRGKAKAKHESQTASALNAVEDQGRFVLQEMLDDLAQQVWSEQSYLRGLEELFVTHLKTQQAAADASDASAAKP